jgi:phage virion morphogenesis protein
MIRIRIDSANANRRLRDLMRSVSNPAPAMRDIGAALTESTRLRFHDQKDPRGRSWRGHAASTTRQRRRGPGGGSNQILRDTDVLMNSITYKAGSNKVEVGTNVEYAAIHQEGGTAGRGGGVRIPARPFLGVSQEDEAEIIDIMSDYLNRVIR